MFLKYLRAGLVVIPAHKTYAKPIVKWKKYFEEPFPKPTEREADEWDETGAFNYLLVLGEASKIIAIDIDYKISKEDLVRLENLLGKTPCKKFGTKGMTLFYKYNGEKTQKYIKDNKILVELLSNGHNTTIPPSHIPTYKIEALIENGATHIPTHYIWEGQDILNCVERIPFINKNYDAVLRAFLSIQKPVEFIPKKELVKHRPLDKFQEEDIEKMLTYISPDCSYDEWLAVGGGLYDELGEGGFYYFDRWSSGSSKYNARDCRDKWRVGITTLRNYSLGTIVFLARQNGWVANRVEYEEFLSKQIDVRKVIRNQIEENEQVPECYKTAPRHIRALCDWVVSSAQIPQPMLTLGAIMTAVGYAMTDNYTLQNIRPNLYSILIARSATGKQHINDCIRGFLGAVGIREKEVGEKISSDTALFQLLKKSSKIIFIVDECQSLLRSMTTSNKDTPQARIEGVFLQAYTDRVIKGMEYANKEDTEKKGGVIKDAFLQLIGYTTPSSLASSVSQAQVGSGLMGRITLWEGIHLLPEDGDENYNPEARYNPPEEIVSLLKEVRERTILSHLDDETIYKTIPVDCEEEVKERFKQLRKETNILRNELYVSGEFQEEATLMRKTEMIKTFCMIASLGEQITIEHLKWAELVFNEHNRPTMSKFITKMGVSENSEKLDKLENYIKVRGVVSRRQISQNIKYFRDLRELTKALSDLAEMGKIKQIEIFKNGSIKSSQGYEYVG